jgi:hypothetical protein
MHFLSAHFLAWQWKLPLNFVSSSNFYFYICHSAYTHNWSAGSISLFIVSLMEMDAVLVVPHVQKFHINMFNEKCYGY